MQSGKRMTGLEYHIHRAIEKFGDIYDYSKVVWIDRNATVEIGCRKHGPFYQSLFHHVSKMGKGCPECIKDQVRVKKQAQFIEEATRLHKGVWDYSRVEFISKGDKVEIGCKLHGWFKQTPSSHLSGSGCPVCGFEESVKNRTRTTEQFITQAREIHGNTYGYSKTHYVNAHTKVVIECLTHGEFLQKPCSHLLGQGCYKCGKVSMGEKQAVSFDEFVRRARETHGKKFKYLKEKFVGMDKPAGMVCKVHGEFSQLPHDHINGCGCSKCSHARAAELRSLKFSDFVEKSNEVHKGQYIYLEEGFDGSKSKAGIICPKHGKFTQLVNDHQDGHGCPVCGVNLSVKENELFEFVKTIAPDAISRDRSGVAGYGKKLPLELDIFVPSLKLGIEVQGTYWHSNAHEARRGRDWVLNHQAVKHRNCQENGVDLLTIYDDELEDKKGIVFDLISAKAGGMVDKCFARKLTVQDISWADARSFLEAHHLQGACQAAKAKGLITADGNLIALMVFDKARSTRHRGRDGLYEIIRYCSKGRVVGGCSKLLNAFLRSIEDVTKVISYADKRISQGGMYKALGFTLVAENAPDYMYIHKGKRRHKSNYTRAKLEKSLPSFDPELTEEANCFNAGIYKIYNCGLQRWELEL